MPVIQIEVMLLQNDLTPWLEEVIAHLIGTDDREDKMQVRMLQMLVLQTSRTRTATILLCTMGTIEILGIRQGELQFADTGDAGKELCMRNPSLTHRLTQLPLGCLLSYDIAE
jgi:hypothetical protein